MIMNPNRKHATILNGSPRQRGNTAVLINWLERSLQKNRWEVSTYNLYQLTFKGCSHCDACKKIVTAPGCILHDDFNPILANIQHTDLLVLASPVYCWTVSGCLSAALDRFYAFFKYRGDNITSLIKGKKIIGILTSGGDHFDGMDLCISMLKQLCAHGNAEYTKTIAATNCTNPKKLLKRSELQKEISASIKNL